MVKNGGANQHRKYKRLSTEERVHGDACSRTKTQC